MITKIWRRLRRTVQRAIYVRVTDIVDRLSLRDADLSRFPVPPGFEVRRFDATTDGAVGERLGQQLFLDFVRRSATCRGYILWDGELPVGYLWTTDRPRSAEGEAPFHYRISPAPDEVYFFDMKVLFHRRGKGAATGLMAVALQDALVQGKQYAFSTRADWNGAIHRVVSRLGFVPTGKLLYRRVLGVSWRELGAIHG